MALLGGHVVNENGQGANNNNVSGSFGVYANGSNVVDADGELLQGVNFNQLNILDSRNGVAVDGNKGPQLPLPLGESEAMVSAQIRNDASGAGGDASCTSAQSGASSANYAESPAMFTAQMSRPATGYNQINPYIGTGATFGANIDGNGHGDSSLTEQDPKRAGGQYGNL